MKRFIIIISCLLLPSLMMGQQASAQERPSWIDSDHVDGKNSYVDVFSATSHSENSARELAIQRIADARSLATGQRVQIRKRNDNIVFFNATDELTVKCRIVGEYSEYMPTGEYKVWLLVQTAKNPEYSFENVSPENDKYPFSGRVFVPGMAQLHKGSTTKGVLFIVGEVAAISGIVAFEGMRSSYESKIGRTHDAAVRKEYINKAQNMKNIRNGFIAGAAAIYVWNIIDGTVAKGKTRITIGQAEASLTPYTNYDSTGVMLALRF